MESTADMAAAFPGLSTLSWVPLAIKSSSKTMLAGLIPAEANEVFLDRPYRSLKPPGLEG